MNSIGCGAGGVLGVGLNVKTGNMLFLPFNSISGYELKDEYVYQDDEYKSDSYPIICTVLHDVENQCSVRYFIETKGEFYY